MEVGRSISYRVGDDDETPLVIVTDDLGKNLSDKGMKVEGFRDASLTLPTPIFVETRFQAGNYNANPQTQYTSWNTIDGFQNQMTAAQVKVMRKIMLTYGGMDYGTICIAVLNFHS